MSLEDNIDDALEGMDDMEAQGPQEEDYAMEPMGSLGSKVSLGIVNGKHLGTFDTQDEAEEFAWRHMDKEQFWPNLWWISDHGNASVVVRPAPKKKTAKRSKSHK